MVIGPGPVGEMASQVRHSIGAVVLAVAVTVVAWQPTTASAAPAKAAAALDASSSASSLAWSPQHPAVSPPARSGAAMAYDAASGDLLLFGGTGANGQLLSDTWEFNGSSWTQMNQGGMPALTGASMVAQGLASRYSQLDPFLVFSGLAVFGLVFQGSRLLRKDRAPKKEKD